VTRTSTVHPRPAGTAHRPTGANVRRQGAVGLGRRWAGWLIGWMLGLLIALGAAPARAESVQLSALELTRAEDGLQLSFSARFELPHAVEDALMKGVPLYFVAEANLYRGRWYWRDVRVAHASRTWRLAWQPLTRTYRVSFGALNQSFDTLPEAMSAVRGAAHWKIADLSQLEAGASHYLEFSYRLDTSQLPRPMQIGLAGQSDWDLVVERSLRLD
jgi:hypothetical protein